MFIVPITKMDVITSLDKMHNTQSAGQAGRKTEFKDVLKEAVKEADQAVKDNQDMDVKLASGQVDHLHTALIQAEKTAATIEFTTQLASKAVNAYNQIMGMQV